MNLETNPIAEPDAIRLAELLEQANVRIVFAESCTCGMVAGLLGQVPGISNWLCGSAVCYRVPTKQRWLNVPPETVAEHTPESIATSESMAEGALTNTPEASLSVAVTGHLGPDAPDDLDGIIHLAGCVRDSQDLHSVTMKIDGHHRIQRQHNASLEVLKFASQLIKLTWPSRS
ncbi:MAG: CinA family protein [Planctomycetota bacterium]